MEVRFVTAIWAQGGDRWELLKPAGFPDERTLQELVAKSPDLLPLAGSPRIVVLGREVLLGSGYVDVLAIEASGRPVIVEVKLRNNAESRRAVVSQILAYAAALYGQPAEEFERHTVARQLAGRGLLDFVRESAQAEVADSDDFHAVLHKSLQEGSFRLVLVLDAAPQELVRLVGYLEAVTDGLVIDLITVTSYTIADRKVVVPQRVEAERPLRADVVSISERGGSTVARAGELVAGMEGFRERVAAATGEQRPQLDKLVVLADRLARFGSVLDISTYYGKREEVVLLPRFLPERSGLASLYCYADGKAAVQLWRSVFERRAPGSMHAVAAAAGLDEIGAGKMATKIDDELLAAIYDAYVEALVV